MSQVYYSRRVNEFLLEDSEAIYREMLSNQEYDSLDNQKNAWKKQIEILKRELSSFEGGHIIFEYTIARVRDRIDNIFLYKGAVFVLEFKVNSKKFESHAVEQTRYYALDLNSFHEKSHNRTIVPILISTEAESQSYSIKHLREGVLDVINTNGYGLENIIREVAAYADNSDDIDATEWIKSPYRPTPTIIEAAKDLYAKHEVKNIHQKESDDGKLKSTQKEVVKIISQSRSNNEKSICFITGVPGSGKTLAGLNIAVNIQQSTDKGTHACFLTGNQPLVEVLTAALARDAVSDNTNEAKKPLSEARMEIKHFIQNIHNFRDAALDDLLEPPDEHVVVFDEAQRTWDNDKLSSFMNTKKSKLLGKLQKEEATRILSMSESELLIDYLNRHKDWAVIVCLVGGGQDINVGEAGIGEWFLSLKRSYPNWKIYLSEKMVGPDYISKSTLEEIKPIFISNLHLSTAERSYRSEDVSAFVQALIDADKEKARFLYSKIRPVYPIAVTRDLNVAKAWVKKQCRGEENERYGLMATSKAKRLRPEGIWAEYHCTPEKWFLSNKDDMKSSFALEEVATEFKIQGLEIDWGIVGWDADFRFVNGQFYCYNFRGSSWQKISKDNGKRYTKNAYRVLLTRSRQGFIIFVPRGDEMDRTRDPRLYDGIFNYLREVGVEEV